ncbi:hypothetical protein CEUSTIGMA_g3220.t1 [Chlamydomonas eustigma]|uniref:Carotenoid oxygenase n=1 Tax=Chlamydomonas eustigma TaxID=1157962 RepID=A0A250WY61_9CHLO|nr:hypothetical protein CEUSTIGMA_g3220.t1 [Chlamydomonas eustigma]|eukprot:GAX75777.1 hypothetical protein CEUSTIGMA_g3220.t1 [Chlamydomonas eustigma]
MVTLEARRALFGRASEQVNEVEAEVTNGNIPDWISGSLVANGGADYTGMQHMFDGYAMLCKLRFSGGRVYGSQRYIQSKTFSHFSKSGGKMLHREFGTTVPTSDVLQTAAEALKLVGALAAGQDMATDNASVNVTPLADGTIMAVSETMESKYKVDLKTLLTLKKHQYKDGLPGSLTTAHPKQLPDGSLVNFTHSFPFGGYHVYREDPVSLNRKQIAFIRDRDPGSPCWVHDIAVSMNYLVIVEPPAFIDLAAIMSLKEADLGFLAWRPDLGTRVYVVPLNGSGPVRTFNAPPLFFFHTANAYEEGGQLHVDIACSSAQSPKDMFNLIKDLRIQNILSTVPGKEISRSRLARLSIPLGTTSSDAGPGSVPEATLLMPPRSLSKDEGSHGHFAEFPCINPSYSGLKHRYVWGTVAARPTKLGNAIGKFDVETGEVLTWHEEGAHAGAPFFLPSPGSANEDAGVLISVVMKASGKSSQVVVLDAATLVELGRADLGYPVPYRFHAAFIPDNAAGSKA